MIEPLLVMTITKLHEEVPVLSCPCSGGTTMFLFLHFFKCGCLWGGGGVCVASMPYATRKPVLKALKREAKCTRRYILYD